MRRLLNYGGSGLLMLVMVQPVPMLSPRNDLMAQTPSPEAKVAQGAQVEVKVVKYDGLKDAVKDLKGKLVVVDFWSTT